MTDDLKTDTKEKADMEQNRCKNCGAKKHLVEVCPYKDHGTRCFRCNDFGHIGKYCTNKGDNTMEQTNKATSSHLVDTGLHISSWQLRMLHGKTEVEAVVCLGLAETLIREFCVNKFDCLPKRGEETITVKFNNQTIKTMGSYELHLTCSRESFYIRCHVVRDDCILKELLLGMNFIREVEIVVRLGKVKIRRVKAESDEESTEGENSDNDNDWYKDAKKSDIKNVEKSDI